MAGPRDLTTAVLRFGHMLRAAGLPLTIGEMMDGVRALEAVGRLDLRDVYLALRTTLVARHEEFPAFDRCFEAFWRFQAAEGQGLDGRPAPAGARIPAGPARTHAAGARPGRPRRRRCRWRSRAGRSRRRTMESRWRSRGSVTKRSSWIRTFRPSRLRIWTRWRG